MVNAQNIEQIASAAEAALAHVASTPLQLREIAAGNIGGVVIGNSVHDSYPYIIIGSEHDPSATRAAHLFIEAFAEIEPRLRITDEDATDQANRRLATMAKDRDNEWAIGFTKGK